MSRSGDTLSRRAALRWVLSGAAGMAACRAERDFDQVAPPPRPRAGAVVCEHALAAEVGAEVLRRGGNAADAAVATALALAVVLPRAGNLGGGGFAIWAPHVGPAAAIDFRETAPGSARLDRYLDGQGVGVSERAQSGPLSVGCPGSPLGLWSLHQRFGSGRRSFAALAGPAIELAREGFRVDARLARDLAQDSIRERLTLSPTALALFYPQGLPLVEKELFVQSDLARTLEEFARGGPDAFYKGTNVRRIALTLAQSAGRASELGAAEGWLAPADLVEYAVVDRAPLIGWFRGLEVVTMPPPSAGGLTLLFCLSVLDGFALDAERRRVLEERAFAAAESSFESGLDERAVHWWIESLRRAFELRALHLGDPDQVEVDVRELLSARKIARARVDIGEGVGGLDPALRELREGSQTTHLSVLDRQGNAVSLTTTLNSSFGSGLVVADGGFLLNNELDDFALPGAHNQFELIGGEKNFIAPRKRPVSSMTPTLVRAADGHVVLALGSPGGTHIPSAVLGVLLHNLVYGESLARAVAAPRLQQQAVPRETRFEVGWPSALLDGLERRGHALVRDGAPRTSVQALCVQDDGRVEAVTDPRSPGAAILVEA